MQVIQQKTSKQRRRLRYKQIQKIKKAKSLTIQAYDEIKGFKNYVVVGERRHLVSISNWNEILCDCNNAPHCSHVLAVRMSRGEIK